MVGRTKKLILFILLFSFILSSVSAQISLTQSPKNVYNIEDKIEITAKITPTEEISGLLTLYLSCPVNNIEIHKEFLYITQETEKQITIPLTKEYIGETKGQCEIKSKIGTETPKTISKKFTISDSIKLEIENQNSFSPEEEIRIEGTAIKENKEPANGIIKATINGIKTESKIENGSFELKFSLPENTKAGEDSIELIAYETNKQNTITNHKEETKKITIKQIPTNIEIALEEKKIKAGEKLTGKIILRDQTGESIKEEAYIAIKNGNETIEQIKTETRREFDYQIPYYERPTTWTISVYSGEITNKLDFKILENKDVEINIINKTLIIENMGNTIYNETIEVEIGEQRIEVPTNLQIKEIVKYKLEAPTGEYQIHIGDIDQMVSLTGNAIKLEKITNTNSSSFKTFAWIFLIIILSVATYIFFKKGNNKKFLGKKTGKTKEKPLELNEIPQPEKLINTKTNTQISTSINGGKQNAPVGCITLKNYEQVRNGEGGVRESLQEIANHIESQKGVIYENKGNIFFIIPPTRTKSYQNEIPSIKAMKFAQKKLNLHNKKFKQKINFGLSLNYGTIVTNDSGNSFKFMSMGTLITTAKKLSRMSTGQIIIGEKFYEKAKEKIKAQKIDNEEIKAYELTSIKDDTKEHSDTFIKGFLARQKKEKEKNN